MYTLHRSQQVGGNLSQVFAFFKNPHNLELITPQWLRFRILDASDPEVRVGTRIRYGLRLHGLPMRWESVIAGYTENVSFMDSQVTGPYRRWHHEHHFHPTADGVVIEDRVQYELPLGPLGRIVHALAVRRQLQRIFDYRESAIAGQFPLTGARVAAVPA